MMCAIEFIPAGGLRREPLRHEMSPEEMEMLKQGAEAEEAELGEFDDGAAAEDDEDEYEDVDEDNEIENNGEQDGFGLPVSLRMEDYDDDEGIPGLMSKSVLGIEEEDEDDEGSDAEDNIIESSDIVMMSARTDEEISILEVHCYDSKTGNLWIHHDITLAAFPLCMTFMDMPPSNLVDGSSSGAYVAVGTFQPGIEIWNLDVLDPLEPSAVLGGPDLSFERKQTKKGKKKKNKQPPLLPDSHTDAVMALDWNKIHRQILASGGADTVVKLWDVTTQQCSHTCTHHTGKVQSVAWHPTEGPVLATGSYDKTVCVFDVRSPNSVSKMAMAADLECVRWDPHRPERLLGCSEDGTVSCFDPRNPSSACWTINAHSAGVSSLSFAPHVRGLFATVSQDKTVKLWDCAETPQCIGQREMGVGKLFGLDWCGDEGHPWTLACAGSKGMVGLWEVDESEVVANRFASRLSSSVVTKIEATEAVANEVIYEDVMVSDEHQQQLRAAAPVNEKKTKKKKKKDINKKKTITK